MKNQLGKILTILIGKNAYNLNYLCLSRLDQRVAQMQRKKNPSLEDCIKFTEWKSENNQLTDRDKLIIETIFLYETAED